MKIYVHIIFFLLIVFQLNGKNKDELFKISYPQYIPVNTPFDISIISKSRFAEADRLLLTVTGENRLNVTGFSIVSRTGKRPLKFDASGGNILKREINLKENGIELFEFFQIILTLKGSEQLKTKIKIEGVYFNSRDKEKLDASAEIIEPEFYKPLKIAGKAAAIDNGSGLKIDFNNTPGSDVSVQFWFKYVGEAARLMTIKSGTSENDILLNESKIINIVSEGRIIEPLSACFAGEKSWHHIKMDFSGHDKLSVYCNNKQIFKIQSAQFGDKISLLFKGTETALILDQLKIFRKDHNSVSDLADELPETAQNGFQNGYLKAQFNFNTTIPQNKEYDGITVSASGCRLVKSDAPIFPNAPDLNISVFSKAVQLEWSGGDINNAAEYVLEKAGESGGFRQVFKVGADKINGKKYSFIDQTGEDAGIVYYRVRQINSDGSDIFSPQVKVGQGEVDPIIIEQNFPNPFNPLTSIGIEMLLGMEADIRIYNLEGQEVRRIFSGFLEKGSYKFTFDGSDLPSGVYIYKITTPSFTKTKKMILTK